MKYTFPVIAVNKGDQSKPSEPSDPIIAKDRNGMLVLKFIINVFYICLETNFQLINRIKIKYIIKI